MGSSVANDYYELLGVPRDADAAAIKKAFRKRARELHPDVNPSPEAEEEFRTVAAAYEVLSDDERRSLYDRYGEAGLKQQQWEPQFSSFGNVSDIFSALFGDDLFGGRGGGAAARGGTRGDDALVHVDLSFQEAALGVEREVSYEAVGHCDTCEGSGAATEDGVTSCVQCAGAGVVRTVARSIFGQVIQESVCPRCAGRGKIVTDPCTDCHGSGEQLHKHTLTIKIPAGIADGQRIRLSGRGGTGTGGGPAGNLYVDIAVEHDERFLREGDDLITVADLTITEAALGCNRDIDTVDGTAETVEFPAGVQPGEVLVLRGRGMGRLRGNGRGDQRIVVNVTVPRLLDDEQRTLLIAFQEAETHETYAEPHHATTGEKLMDKLRRMLRHDHG